MITKTNNKSDFSLEKNIVKNIVDKKGNDYIIDQIIYFSKKIKDQKDEIEFEDYVELTFWVKELNQIFKFDDNLLKESFLEKIIKLSKEI